VKFRRLGRTDYQVSEIGHGLWGMGGWAGSDDAQSLDALRASANGGCNFFDSAYEYGDGRSDRLLGRLLAANPGRRLYAASKIPPQNRHWPGLPEDSFPTSSPGIMC